MAGWGDERARRYETTQAQKFLQDAATDNRKAPMTTILDEQGQSLQKSEEKLEWWKQHFEKVLMYWKTLNTTQRQTHPN